MLVRIVSIKTLPVQLPTPPPPPLDANGWVNGRMEFP